MDDMKRGGHLISAVRMQIHREAGNPYEKLVKAYANDKALLLDRLSDTAPTRDGEGDFTKRIQASQVGIDQAHGVMAARVRQVMQNKEVNGKDIGTIRPEDAQTAIDGITCNAKSEGLIEAHNALAAKVTDADRENGMVRQFNTRGSWLDAVRPRTAEAIAGGLVPKQPIGVGTPK